MLRTETSPSATTALPPGWPAHLRSTPLPESRDRRRARMRSVRRAVLSGDWQELRSVPGLRCMSPRVNIMHSIDTNEPASLQPATERLKTGINLLRAANAEASRTLEIASRVKDLSRPLFHLKYVWLYSRAMTQVLTPDPEKGQLLWNVPALAALCRPIQEAFVSLYYFAIEQVNKEESAFRDLLWNRHAVFKRLDLIRRYSAQNALAAAELPEAEKAFQQIDEKVRSHPHWASLDKDSANRLKNPENYISQSTNQIWSHAGLPEEMYDAVFRLLSQFSHVTPYAMVSLLGHHADSEEGAENMNVPINLALMCLCRSLSLIGSINDEFDAILDPGFKKFMQNWSQ